MKRPVLSLLFFISAVFVSGQTIRELQGTVRSSNSREVLAGATVTIYNKGAVSGLVANKEGRFSLPSGTYYDSIKISMVGHKSRVYLPGQPDMPASLDINLEIAPAALQEVIVKPFTALDVIKRAIAKIAVNQPRDDFESRGFYRELIRDRGNYFSVAEAVFLAQYFPSQKEYRLKLEQGRSKEDVTYTRLFEDFHPGGGPQTTAGNSFLVGRPEFLDLKEIANFRYQIDSMVQYDGHWLYHISFDQKPGVKQALDKGYLLIDTDDDAVVRYEVQNSPLGTPYIKSLTGSDKLVAGLLRIDFKRKGWKRQVDFARIKDKWVMSYAGTEYEIAYKQPGKQLDLDLTISLELAFTDLYRPLEKVIAKTEEWKRKNIVANLPTAFDSTFWGGNSIISPTEQVKNIIAGIARINSDLPAVSGVAGWESLNRNLFVSYRRNDTITLIPVMKCNWEDETNGGFLFREMDSNFAIESKISVVKNSDPGNLPDRGFQQAGLLVRSAGDSSENYVFLSIGTGGNPNPRLFFKRTLNNKSRTVTDKKESMSGWIRLEKSGKKITAYFKEEKEPEFKKAGEYNLDWLNGKLQVGMAVFAAFAGDGPKMKPDLKVDFSQLKIITR